MSAVRKKVREVVDKNNFYAEVIKVDMLMDIMKYGVMITAALIINEKLYARGTPLPSTEQLISWIKEHHG